MWTMLLDIRPYHLPCSPVFIILTASLTFPPLSGGTCSSPLSSHLPGTTTLVHGRLCDLTYSANNCLLYFCGTPCFYPVL
ncbi:hypothetical protein B0O80DRAFT_450610 [Mortierella sp. GBAus27b]|nr:hypothetical protein B0O80DRAFT_450610 [Mortierella sp. GBAus27b]